ncbi:MAG: NUDIX domain-containing protein [Chloroflexi bacterium]|nr:NUDIX domain-containing protein [Chloroflexota bacterium]
MRWQDQGTHLTDRHRVIPRALCLITHGGKLLLIRAAPHKRLWAGKLNGIGGHIEPDETPLEGALREVSEETGLQLPALRLCGIIHVADRRDPSGIMVFVYLGEAPTCEVTPSGEGTLEWHALDALPWDEMVADMPSLVPQVLNLAPDELLYGHYTQGENGEVVFRYMAVRGLDGN